VLDPAHAVPPLVNVGCGQDQTILELASVVAEVIGYGGGFVFDKSKPDGTMRKLLDVRRMTSLGWRPTTSLRAGIERAYGDFRERGISRAISI
jgi:GDP-L-fucose synthase